MCSPADTWTAGVQSLSMEHKVQLLQREHPGTVRQELLQALEAGSGDLSVASALLLAQNHSPRAQLDAQQVRSLDWTYTARPADL